MKTSGSNTYATFTNGRANLERTARGHSEAIHTFERRLQHLVERQARLFGQLSSLHIDAEIELPVSVRASMDARHSKIEATKQEVETTKDRLSALKRQRAQAESDLSKAEQTLQREYAAVESRFDADPRVVELRGRLAAISLALAQLKDKRRRAETELDQKRTAYEEDRFFNYLRDIGYGTPDYSAILPFWRTLDARLANKTRFLEEIANYDRLLAVPDWWQERIDTVSSEEKKESAEFDELRRTYFHKLTPMEQVAEGKTADLRDVDGEIEKMNARMADANHFLSNAALAEDSELKKITAELSAILRRTGLDDLRQLAARTAGTEDDAIVAELQAIVAEAEQVSGSVAVEKRRLYDVERKIEAFKQVEDHIRRKRWNNSGHGFRNIDADRLSQQLSQDALNAGLVIGTLNNSHVDPPQESHSGSGGSWGGSSSGGGSMGGSSSSSSDSFSTGSSFGGSDSYSTGDSF